MRHQGTCFAAGLLLAFSLQAAEPPEGPAVNTSPATPAQPEDGRAPPRRPQVGLAPETTSAASDAAASETPAAATPSAAPRTSSADRIELGTTQITGNSELPRVMYVVPWKRAELGDLAGRPARSLLDEVLAPVDRDVFRRQNRYYEALRPDAASGEP
jgi:hypothetical protein